MKSAGLASGVREQSAGHDPSPWSPGKVGAARGSMKSEARIALALLAILVVAALLNTYFLPLAGRHARPEHIAAPLVFAAFVGWRLLRREPAIRFDAFSALAAAWVIVNGISSWLYAPQPAESFVHVVRM